MDNKQIAELLLKSKAVTLSPDKPYTYASGIKSPIYCDNRVLMSKIEERGKIIEAFEELFKEHGVSFDVIAGTATSGIPWAAWLAEKENAPLVYVRGKKKEHGKQKEVEGEFEKGRKVLVIEDLVSTGKSSVAAVEACKRAGGVVENCCAIFTYGMKKARDKFDRVGCRVLALTDFETLIEVAVAKKHITNKQADIAKEWNKDPEGWGKKYGYY